MIFLYICRQRKLSESANNEPSFIFLELDLLSVVRSEIKIRERVDPFKRPFAGDYPICALIWRGDSETGDFSRSRAGFLRLGSDG